MIDKHVLGPVLTNLSISLIVALILRWIVQQPLILEKKNTRPSVRCSFIYIENNYNLEF